MSARRLWEASPTPISLTTPYSDAVPVAASASETPPTNPLATHFTSHLGRRMLAMLSRRNRQNRYFLPDFRQ
ncbi:hypothetical protein PLANPX_0334 [Lacipirellula parvula]|uniref:Uncharacterized protein n=1 Tax=Lacipirellula parvula TaxID=2650471 RepID=A0A5K7X4I7_9BACT|nr:hypothetical protein PLANPX_0334 [Lacipirellula parvula]